MDVCASCGVAIGKVAMVVRDRLDEQELFCSVECAKQALIDYHLDIDEDADETGVVTNEEPKQTDFTFKTREGSLAFMFGFLASALEVEADLDPEEPQTVLLDFVTDAGKDTYREALEWYQREQQVATDVKITLTDAPEQDISLTLPTGQVVVLQYRNYEGKGSSIDVCLPEATAVHTWGDDELTPSKAFATGQDHIRLAKQASFDFPIPGSPPPLKKYEVTYQAWFKVQVEVPWTASDDEINDAVQDIDVPENESSKYVAESFEVIKEKVLNPDDAPKA